MNLYDFVFYVFAAIVLISGFLVVTTRNIVYSAFYLLFTLFGVAGLYVLLGADFLAVVQIVVYVGGILILILFGVMLTNKITNVQIKTGTMQIIPAVIGALGVAGLLVYSLFNTRWKTGAIQFSDRSTAYSLGRILLTDYVLIFEVLGVLLLIALIGAATIARREKE